ncbi:uncharacterized protein LOC124452057 [Xenia sp. Carnegie-2017]|uniref:uncharacterized protein LOC124452057 n=1 Tax=Xenia sp. Carnegie-2017 TaxID=2897299 RepID=UPI001F040038|nr:uncharacterized protein LOC124452057 [Xenia sp. Carnegie-2017]
MTQSKSGGKFSRSNNTYSHLRVSTKRIIRVSERKSKSSDSSEGVTTKTVKKFKAFQKVRNKTPRMFKGNKSSKNGSRMVGYNNGSNSADEFHLILPIQETSDGRSYLNDDLDDDEMYFLEHKEESVEDDFLNQLENSKINTSLDK